MKIESFVACERTTLSPDGKVSAVNMISILKIQEKQLPVRGEIVFIVRLSGRAGESSALMLIVTDKKPQNCGTEKSQVTLPDEGAAELVIKLPVLIRAAGRYTAWLNVTNSESAESRAVGFDVETFSVH